MRKKKLFFMTLILCMLLSACVQRTTASEAVQSLQPVTEMTEEEKRLFCEIFPMEDRIMEGRLYGYQEIALEGLRAGRSYLETEYAGHEIEVKHFQAATKADPWYILYFSIDNDETMKELRVYPEEKGFTYREMRS